ncbi:MAG: hypothetical protein ABJH04_00935 [Cyclobacteriaceae bacterium]
MKTNACVIISFVLFFFGCQQDTVNPDSGQDNTKPGAPKVITLNSAKNAGSTNGRILYRKPNGLVVRTSAGQLKLFPFRNNTFYGNGGGQVVGSGYSYQNYLPADWNNDGKTDLVLKDNNHSLWFAPFNNGSFALQPGDVGVGFSQPALAVGEWWTPSGFPAGDPDTPDLVGFWSTGATTIYPFKSHKSSGFGTFKNGGSYNAGITESGYTTHYLLADWSGDGLHDIIARNSLGHLNYYKYDGNTYSFVHQGLVGHGFFFTDYFITDREKDGKADGLLVRDNNGLLKLFNFNSTFYNQPCNGYVIGSGFHYTDYFVGEWAGGSNFDIIGRDSAGDMYLHRSTFACQPSSQCQCPPSNAYPYFRVKIGHGWFFDKYFMGTW